MSSSPARVIIQPPRVVCARPRASGGAVTARPKMEMQMTEASSIEEAVFLRLHARRHGLRWNEVDVALDQSEDATQQNRGEVGGACACLWGAPSPIVCYSQGTRTSPGPGLCPIHLSNLHSIQRDVRHMIGRLFFFFLGTSE